MKKLIWQMWKSGKYKTAEELYSFLSKRNFAPEKAEVEDVIKNLPKYDKQFKQSQEERFFIEFQRLLQKYQVEIFIANAEEKSALIFDFPDKQFELTGDIGTELTATNTFANVEDDKEFFGFPGEQYFDEENINLID